MNRLSTCDAALTREAAETPDLAARQIARLSPTLRDLGARLRARPPRVVVTCARGSSDHAASYGKFLLETQIGTPVASVGPSVVSLYGAPLKLEGALFVAVSQSGRSPDLLSLTAHARANGALVVGFVNDESSPLADLCDVVGPLGAGPETSVAATKSYLLSGLALMGLVAHWSGQARALQTLEGAPERLAAAARLDWSPALDALRLAQGLFVVGRGASLGAAQEAALKFKETSRLHAEAFSSAEVIHGPLALAGPNFPVLALGQADASAPSFLQSVGRIAALGSPVWSTLEAPGAETLPTVPDVDPNLAPLCQTLSFYMALAGFARARGFDPDRPPHLAKVTETM
jgi:glucosamine--fructose-6-phosphate aminotransferase (isomerizing)